MKWINSSQNFLLLIDRANAYKNACYCYLETYALIKSLKLWSAYTKLFTRDFRFYNFLKRSFENVLITVDWLMVIHQYILISIHIISIHISSNETNTTHWLPLIQNSNMNDPFLIFIVQLFLFTSVHLKFKTFVTKHEINNRRWN